MIAFLKEYFQIKNWVPYDQPQRKRIMAFVLWCTLVAGILLGIVNFYLKAYGAGLILLVMSLLCIIGLRLNHYGHYLSAGILVSLMVLIALDANLIDGNGTRDTGIVALPVFVMLGSLFFGKRSSPAFTLAAIGSTILVTYLSIHGDIPKAYHASFNDGITISILIIISALLTWVVMDTLEKDTERLKQSETDLRTAYDQSLLNLEKLKRAEAELRESEERFSKLSEVSSEGIGISDQGRIVDANPQLVNLFGYNPGELIGLNASDFVAPESRDLVMANEQAEFDGPYEHMAIKKDGTIFPVEIRAKTIPYKGRQTRVAIIRDMTEHKRAENALRESEAQFRHLWEATIEGIVIHEQGTILEVNEAAGLLFGYARDQAIGKSLLDFAPPETRDRLRNHFMSDSPGPFEVYYIRPDGKRLILEIYARQIFYRGKPARMTAIRDITNRKQIEENLSLQIDRLRALHTIEQAVTSSMDLHTILELLARQIVEQLQVDAASVLLLNPHKQTLDYAAGQGFQTHALQYTSLKIGSGLAGRAAKERQIVHIADLTKMKDNPILTHSIVDEKFVSYFGVPLIAKDQVLGVLEIFHRSALAPDPNWLRFLETLAGPAAISIDNARLLEMTLESLKETNALYRINQDLASTMDPTQLMENVVNLLQANFGYYYVQIFVIQPETGDFVFRAGSGKIGEQLKSQGYRLAAGEGIVGYTAETGKPFFTNNVEEMISFVRAPYLADTKSELAVPIKAGDRFLGLLDIHQMPPAVLTELDVQLVSAVADQLAVALQKAQLYADLQNSLLQEQATRAQLIHNEKLATAGRLLASVSHELNNPLQAIQNALFLLKDEKGISALGQQDLRIVLSEAERMASLLERLRNTYQPLGAEEFQPVQMNDIIEDVRVLVATHLRHASISFEFHSDPELPAIPGLGNQIKQVLLNLFMNAVDAMPGGGRLVASTACLAERQEILITISDTGTGIDESILPNLFEAFITNKDKGTGLGLAISYEIIQKHRGRIRAENMPEGGARFSIWLPVGNGASQ